MDPSGSGISVTFLGLIVRTLQVPSNRGEWSGIKGTQGLLEGGWTAQVSCGLAAGAEDF